MAIETSLKVKSHNCTNISSNWLIQGFPWSSFLRFFTLTTLHETIPHILIPHIYSSHFRHPLIIPFHILSDPYKTKIHVKRVQEVASSQRIVFSDVILFCFILDLKYFLCSMYRNYLWQVSARYDLSSRYLLTWNSCSPFPTHLMSVRSVLSLMSVSSLSDLVVSVSLVVSHCTALHQSCLTLENKALNVLAASITWFHNNPGILRGYVCQEFLTLFDKNVSEHLRLSMKILLANSEAKLEQKKYLW